MIQRHSKARENSRAMRMLHALLGERAGVRASFSSDLMSRVSDFVRSEKVRLLSSSPSKQFDVILFGHQTAHYLFG
jgi:hypothetical protein